MLNCIFTWQPEKVLKNYFLQNVNNKINVTFVDKKDEASIIEKAKTADVLVGWVLNESILKTAKNLKFILYPGAGVQQINSAIINILKEKQIVFANSHGNSFATAQHALALTLSLTNQVFLHHQLLKKGNWRAGDKEGKTISLKNRKVGLLGFGNIAKHLFRMLKGFDCEFLVYKNSDKIDAAYQNEIKLFSEDQNNFEAFLSEAEIIICTLPKTDLTIDLINKKNIKLLQKSALLINVGRGDVINEAALYNALEQKQITAAAIDVWYNYKPKANAKGEQFPFQQPFQKLDNIILSPHRAASPLDDYNRFTDLVYNINQCSKANPSLVNMVDFERGY